MKKTNVKRFYDFLVDHDYTDSWDSKLTLSEGDFVKYRDQGGWFMLEEDLTFTYHNADEETNSEIFDLYEDFLFFFKSNYCCY